MRVVGPVEGPANGSASRGGVTGEGLLGAPEVAELLQISEETVNARRKAGFLPSVRRDDGSYGYPEQAVSQLLGLAPGERLLRRKQAAARLEIGKQTVTDWYEAGKLRGVVVPGGRERRYPESEVERLRKQIRSGLEP